MDQASKEVWDEMTLVKETFCDLGSIEREHEMIENASNDIYSELSQICPFFGVSLPWRIRYRFSRLADPTDSFFGDRETREKDQKKMLYQFKHVIYALKKMKTAQPPVSDETKLAVRLLFEELFDMSKFCMTAWIELINNFESKRNEYCDCPSCTLTREKPSEPILKTRLDSKLVDYKKECFKQVIIKAYNHDEEHDGQSAHTVRWYERQLPHLNLYIGYDDEYADISRTRISPEEIEERFVKEYTETIKTYVKTLISYGSKKGDGAFRDLTLSFVKGIIVRDAELSHSYLDEGTATNLATDWIWDKENNYEVRDGFLGALLYSFDHFAFDPTSEMFNNTQVNGRAFSENLDLFRNKVLGLTNSSDS